MGHVRPYDLAYARSKHDEMRSPSYVRGTSDAWGSPLANLHSQYLGPDKYLEIAFIYETKRFSAFKVPKDLTGELYIL